MIDKKGLIDNKGRLRGCVLRAGQKSDNKVAFHLMMKIGIKGMVCVEKNGQMKHGYIYTLKSFFL